MNDEPIRLLLINKEDKFVVIGLKKGVIAQLDSKTLQPLSVTRLKGDKPSELISMANTADPNIALMGDQGNK